MIFTIKVLLLTTYALAVYLRRMVSLIIDINKKRLPFVHAWKYVLVHGLRSMDSLIACLHQKDSLIVDLHHHCFLIDELLVSIHLWMILLIMMTNQPTSQASKATSQPASQPVSQPGSQTASQPAEQPFGSQVN